MNRWKHDPLYRRIFAEISALWGDLDPKQRPEALRVEENFTIDWTDPNALSFLASVWMFDDFGVRSVPGLRRESFQPAEVRGEFYRFGLVRFLLSEDRTHLSFLYRLGPEIGGDIVYRVDGHDDVMELKPLSGEVCLAW